MSDVLAILNQGEWFFVAEGYGDLEMGREVSVGQCESCGGFAENRGEITEFRDDPKVMNSVLVGCSCGMRWEIEWVDENRVVFP